MLDKTLLTVFVLSEQRIYFNVIIEIHALFVKDQNKSCRFAPVADPIKLFFLCFLDFAVKLECFLHREKNN